MKKGSEHRLWQYVRVGIQHAGDLVRIEAHEVGTGTPDVNFCLRGVEGNLELKYAYKNDKFELRSTQYRWFQRRVEAGGNCWVLAEHEDGFVHWIALIEGKHYRMMKDQTDPDQWRSLAIAEWEGGKVDFDELIDYLTGAVK